MDFGYDLLHDGAPVSGEGIRCGKCGKVTWNPRREDGMLCQHCETLFPLPAVPEPEPYKEPHIPEFDPATGLREGERNSAGRRRVYDWERGWIWEEDWK